MTVKSIKFLPLFFYIYRSIDKDDFRGDCNLDNDTFIDFKPVRGTTLSIPKRYNSKYPLLRTINEATALALEQITHETEPQIPNQDKHSNSSSDSEIPHEHGNHSSVCSKQNAHIFYIAFTLILITSPVFKLL